MTINLASALGASIGETGPFVVKESHPLPCDFNKPVREVIPDQYYQPFLKRKESRPLKQRKARAKARAKARRQRKLNNKRK